MFRPAVARLPNSPLIYAFGAIPQEWGRPPVAVTLMGIPLLSLTTVLPEIVPEPSMQANPNNENASEEHREIADAKQSRLSLVC
jgi:hypothetical protein